MSLALCLKAKICKKGKSIKNMEEGSRGRPWSAPNWAKMAKFIFSKKKNQKKRQELPWHYLKKLYIYQNSQRVGVATWKRGLWGRPWGPPIAPK